MHFEWNSPNYFCTYLNADIISEKHPIRRKFDDVSDYSVQLKHVQLGMCSRSIFCESRSLNHVQIWTRFNERQNIGIERYFLLNCCSNLESVIAIFSLLKQIKRYWFRKPKAAKIIEKCSLIFFKKDPIFGKSRLAQWTKILKKIQTIKNQNFDEVNDVQMNVWTWFSERDYESIDREQACNSGA